MAMLIVVALTIVSAMLYYMLACYTFITMFFAEERTLEDATARWLAWKEFTAQMALGSVMLAVALFVYRFSG